MSQTSLARSRTSKLAIAAIVVVYSVLMALTGVISIGTAEAAPYNIERVQYAFDNDNPPMATLGDTPEEGNLLIAAAFSRTGASTDDHVISGSDWTKQLGHNTLLGDSDHRRAMSVWTKTAGAAEPTTVTVSGDSGDVKLLVQEFTTPAPGTFALAASAVNDNGDTNDAGMLSTGTTGAVAGNSLWVSLLGVRNARGANINSVNWDVTGDAVNSNGGSFGRTLNSAYAVDTTAGTKTDTATWSGDNSGATAALLVFSAPDMCVLVPQDGRTIVDFNPYDFIRSDKDEAQATKGPVATSLDAGEYTVTLQSYDEHDEKQKQDQPNESWMVQLWNGADLVATTNAISDLPEDENILLESVGTVELDEAVDAATAFHAAYEDENPNSIYPICAAFDEVVEDGEVLEQVDEPVGAVNAGGGGGTATSPIAVAALATSLAVVGLGAYRLKQLRA